MAEAADVLVVGAGLAGLVAARDLCAPDDPCSSWRRGTGSAAASSMRRSATGKILEMGGQWAGPTQDQLLGLATELKIATFPTYDTGKKVLHFNGRRGTYAGTIPRISPLVLADIGQAQARLEALARKVPTDAPWTAPGAEKLDGQTFETWARRNTASKSARKLLTLGAEAVFAAEPGDLSMLHVLFYSHSGCSFQRLIDTTGGAQQDRFVGGSALIAERLAAGLGDIVRLSAPVSRIEVRDGKVIATTGVATTGTATTAAGQFEGPADHRHNAAAAGRPDRILSRAAALAGAADPAHADGLGDQVPGDLRRAVLAAGRAVRPGHR